MSKKPDKLVPDFAEKPVTYLDVEDEVQHFCDVCGGECFILGTLGNRTHYRCRNCGMDSSQKDG